jgi:protein TonB
VSLARFTRIDPSDRMAYALGAAAVLHAVVILGVSFSGPDTPPGSATPTLEVVLDTAEVPSPTPDDAEYYGREDSIGGGNTRDDVPPLLTHPDEMPQPEDSEADGNATARDAAAGSDLQDLVASRSESNEQVPRDLQPQRPDQTEGSRHMLTLAPIVRSDNLRERVLTASTRQTLFADYLVSWKEKVERVGTLNFPDAARRLGLEGSPVLEVAIAADGTLESISVIESSGQPALDEAAERILRLASPFDPFPRDLRSSYDVLRFSYEWRFIKRQGAAEPPAGGDSGS